MKIDLFTKIILTGIFICLMILTFKSFDIVQTATAGKSEVVNVNIQKFGGHYVSKGLPVVLLKK